MQESVGRVLHPVLSSVPGVLHTGIDLCGAISLRSGWNTLISDVDTIRLNLCGSLSRTNWRIWPTMLGGGNA